MLTQVLMLFQGIRNPCVTCIKVPEGVHWKDITDFAMKKWDWFIFKYYKKLAFVCSFFSAHACV